MLRISPKGGILVTENGTAVHEPTVEEAKDDKPRIAYYESYLAAMHEAIAQGADVRAYYAWSFMDNFGEGMLCIFSRTNVTHKDYRRNVRRYFFLSKACVNVGAAGG